VTTPKFGTCFVKIFGNYKTISYISYMKTCSKCQTPKELSKFRKRKNSIDGYSGICKVCSSDYQKEHYQKNKQIYKDKSSVWRNSERDKFNDYLNTLSCIDCGESDPIVLEFDHQVDKKFNISRGAGTMSFDKLMNEISKCEVVCANCHRKRTAKTFGWRKGRLV
jgi:hypothetical protein